MKDYISIKELSDILGISRQSVYKQLSTKLTDYVKTVDGQKMIDSSALSEVYGLEIDNQSCQNESTIVNHMSTEIEYLKEQIKVKDKQIEDLQRLMSQQQELHMIQMKKIPMLTADLERDNPEENEPEPKKTETKPKKSRWKFWRSNK